MDTARRKRRHFAHDLWREICNPAEACVSESGGHVNAPIPFPSQRASVDLSGKPLTECLNFWAGDLRRRGLVAEASYLDAAVAVIRHYENAEAAREKPREEAASAEASG
jgi:hypothetical protein